MPGRRASRILRFDAGGNIDTFGLLVNYWIDVPTGTPVTPYVGAGIGLGIYRADDIDLPEFGAEIADDTALALAWQLGAGVAWRITPQISVSADYRWFNSTNPEFDLSGTEAEFELEASSHNAIAGVRFDF